MNESASVNGTSYRRIFFVIIVLAVFLLLLQSHFQMRSKLFHLEDSLEKLTVSNHKIKQESKKDYDMHHKELKKLQEDHDMCLKKIKLLQESTSSSIPTCSAGDMSDYKKLTLEIALQQKLTRYLWQPQNANPIQKVVIVTDIFNPPIRINEPLIVLQGNLLNHFVESIVLMYTEDQDISWKDRLINKEKIIFHKMVKRFTPGDVVEYGNKHLQGKIIVMTNNDILFDNTLINMRDFDKSKKVFWAISRRRSLFDLRRGAGKENVYYYHQDLCFPYFTSHDAYIWTPTVEKSIEEDFKKFHLGEWGCENRILWHFQQNGYKVGNPCSRINLWHYQTTYYPKSHDNRVNGGMSGTAPSDPIDPALDFSMTWDPKMTIMRS